MTPLGSLSELSDRKEAVSEVHMEYDCTGIIFELYLRAFLLLLKDHTDICSLPSCSLCALSCPVSLVLSYRASTLASKSSGILIHRGIPRKFFFQNHQDEIVFSP